MNNAKNRDRNHRLETESLGFVFLLPPYWGDMAPPSSISGSPRPRDESVEGVSKIFRGQRMGEDPSLGEATPKQGTSFPVAKQCSGPEGEPTCEGIQNLRETLGKLQVLRCFFSSPCSPVA